MEDRLLNPVTNSGSRTVRIIAVRSETEVAVADTDGEQAFLIRLHSLIDGLDDERRMAAMDLIEAFGPVVLLYIADPTCDITGRDGSDLIPGQLFSLEGENISEALLLQNLAIVDTSNQCDSELVQNCYSALLAQGSTENPTPSPTPEPTPTPEATPTPEPNP